MNASSRALVPAPSPPELRLVPPARALRALPSEPHAPEQQAAPAVRLPELPPLPFALIGRIAAAAYEAVEGSRQVAQLARWITPRVTGELSRIRALNVERRSLNRDSRRVVPTVQRVRAVSPAHGIVEASVVLNTPHRARAVALRFEYARGTWRASSITVL